jgi:two-component system, OmpR family, phosphate regulon sensor histidine kinase PhoR
VRSSTFLKLIGLCLAVIAASAIIYDVTVSRAWQASLRAEIERDLNQKATLFAHRVESDGGAHSLSDLAAQEGEAAGARATIIDASGKVLADSEANPASMENHASRAEFVAALHGQTGTAERRSATLGIPFLYVARPIASGGAVRLAYPLSDVEAVSAQVHRRLLWSTLLASLVALLIAAIGARSIGGRLQRIVSVADRLAAGDLKARIDESSGDEIGRLASVLDQTGEKVEASFEALQSSQLQLETLLNSMRDAVIAVGPDLQVRWANQTMDRLAASRTRLHAPVVETVRDPDFLAVVSLAARSREIHSARATSIVPGRAYEVTAAPLPDGGAVAVLRDLTETERVEKTRRDFIANVSHELRTPLTSIQGYSETLLDTPSVDGGTREFLEIIRKNAARMARLTEDLLTLARVESGETRFEMKPTAPVDLLKDAEESFREIARGQGIELDLQNPAPSASPNQKVPPAEALPSVLADPEAIHQVFSNLIDNALKYGRSGNRIVLGARPAPGTVEFYVQDFGAGIASEHLPRLFERFYRVDKARSRESGGTGLGLAITKHIVLAHGGTVRAESDLGHGSAFLFTLPISLADQLNP